MAANAGRNFDVGSLAEAIGDALIAVDKSLNVLYSNAAAKDLLGLLEQESVRIRLRSVKSQITFEHDYGGRCHRIRATPIAEGLAIQVTEITPERDREEQFRTLLANTPDVISRFDRDLRFTYISPAVERVTGLPPEHFIGKTHEEAGLSPEVSELLRASLRRIFETGLHDHVLFDLPSAEGVRQFLGIGIPERSANGTIVSALSIVRDLTEQRRAETELRRTSERLNLAHTIVGIADWSFDIQSRELEWSASVREVYGIGPDEPDSYATWWRHVHPEDQDLIRREFEKALTSDNPVYSVEHRCKRFDGSIGWVLLRGRIERDEFDRPVRSVGISLDITDRKKTEEALRESHDRLQLIQTTTGVGVWQWDLQTDTLTWTDEIYSNLGFSREEYPATVANWMKRIHPDDRERAGLEMEQALESASFLDAEFRIMRKDGSIRWLLSKARIMRASSGKPIRVVGLNIDLTDRMQATQALEESEERQRLAIDAGHIGLWDWDVAANRMIWSDRIYEFHGLQRGEFDGAMEGFTKLIHPDDSARLASAMKVALEEDKPYSIEFRTIRPNGEVRWLATRARTIRGRDGTPVRMLGATLDVTDRRHAEDALRKSNDELEQFAYVASHDLQEPLRMVKIYSQLLLRRFASQDDEQIRVFSGFIESGVTRLETLIHDVLAYSKTIHDERVQERASLSESVTRAISGLQERMAATHAELIIGPLPVVGGDERQFAQVFQNLISNALKYSSPHTPPRIEISARRKDSEWVVEVKDNGIGFDQRYAERIFGLFKRLHKDEYPGSGLGLAICRRIMERYDGRIWAESALGQGARFFLGFPCRPSSDRLLATESKR